MDADILFSNFIVAFQLQKEMRKGVCVHLYVSSFPRQECARERARTHTHTPRAAGRGALPWTRMGGWQVDVSRRAGPCACRTQVSEAPRHSVSHFSAQCKDTSGGPPPSLGCPWATLVVGSVQHG